MKALLKLALVTAAASVTSFASAGDLWTTLDFSRGDARLYTGDGDWDYGAYKGECGQYLNAVAGISSTDAGSCPFLDPTCNMENTRKLLCTSEPFVIDIGRGYALTDFPSYDARNDLSTGNWTGGLQAKECATNEAVVGVSQQWAPSSGLVFNGIKCAPIMGARGHANCQVMNFHDRDARETTARGDWDRGFHKGECAPGRYVKGVATGYQIGENPAGARVRRILCCSPTF